MATRPDRSGGDSSGKRRWSTVLGSALSYWLWRRWRGGRRRKRGRSSAVRQESMERGHEPEGASESIGGILGATALLVLSVAAVIVALNAFVGFLSDREAAPAPEPKIASADAAISEAPPKPRLQVEPAIDLQELHQREHRRLHTYGRVDSARLHIPIDRAMQLVAERGLPADTSAAGGDSLRIPTESGFRMMSRHFPGPPRSEPFLGSSPETYTPAPEFRRALTEEGYLPRSSRADTAR